MTDTEDMQTVIQVAGVAVRAMREADPLAEPTYQKKHSRRMPQTKISQTNAESASVWLEGIR